MDDIISYSCIWDRATAYTLYKNKFSIMITFDLGIMERGGL